MGLRKEFLAWHYMNAIENKKTELEEEDQFRRYLMLLIQPEMYKELERRENPEVVFESKIDLEKNDLTFEDMKKIAAKAKVNLDNIVSTQAPGPVDSLDSISLTEE